MSFFFDFSPQDKQTSLDLAQMNPLPDPGTRPDPSFWNGMGWNGEGAILPTFVRQGALGALDNVEQFGADMLSRGLDMIPGKISGTLQGYVQKADARWRDFSAQVKALDMAPEDFGLATQITSGFIKVALEMGATRSPASAFTTVGLLEGNAAENDAVARGVDKQTASEVGLVTGLSAAAGVVLPYAKAGLTALQNVGFGATVNTAFGIAGRAGTSEVLRANGYPEMADQIRAFDLASVLVDAGMGAGFGVLGHYMHSDNPGMIARALEARDAGLTLTEAAARHLRAPGSTPDSPASIPANFEARANVLENSARFEELATRGDEDRFQPIPPPEGAEFVERKPNTEAMAALEAALEEMGPTPPKKVQAKDFKEWSFNEDPLVRYLVDNLGGLMSKSGYRAKHGKEKLARNSELWEAASKLENPRHNEIFKKNGLTPDEAVTALAEAGFLPHDAHVDQLWEALRQKSASDMELSRQATGRAADINEQAIAEYEKAQDPATYAETAEESAANARKLGESLGVPEEQYDGLYSKKPEEDIGAELMWRVDNDYDALSKQYAELDDPQRGISTDGGRIFNTDYGRELSAGFRADRTRAQEVHDAASYLVGKLYTKRLSEPTPEGREPRVLLTAGGAGAGKSSSLATLGASADRFEIIYDTTMSTASSAISKITQALESGREVSIVYTYRDPVDAFVNGSLPRAMESGRTVTVEAHAKTHSGSREVIPQLIERFRGDDRVDFIVVDNSHGPDGAQLSSIEKLPEAHDTTLEGTLYERARSEYEAGRISEAVYNGTTGKRSFRDDAQGAHASGGAGNDSQPEYAREGKPSQAGSSAERVEAVTRELTDTEDGKAVHESGLVSVVYDPSEFPKRSDGQEHDPRAQAVFQDGKVYLAAKNIEPGQVRALLLHEVGEHFGMERMLGSEVYESLLADVLAKAEAGEKAFADALEVARRADTPERHLAKETLAYLIQNHAELGLVQRIISAVKTFVHGAFGGRFVELNAADLRYLAEASLRRVARTEGASPVSNATHYAAQDALDAKHDSESLYALKAASDDVRKELRRGGSITNALRLVSDAAGRKLTVREASGLRERLLKAATYVDSAIGSPEMRLEAAAKMVAESLEADAVQRVQNAMKNQAAAKRTEAELATVLRQGIPLFGKRGAIMRLLGNNYDGRANVQSLEAHVTAKRNESLRKFISLYHDSGKFLGFWENVEFTHDLIREVFTPGSTGNAKAAEGAKVWGDVSADLLQQLQQAGRPIHELANWAIPTSHSQIKIAKAGIEAWVSRVFPLLKRERYRNPDGTPMTDEQLVGSLSQVYESLSTDGILGQEAGGNSGAANIAGRRTEQSRFLHFKDGDAWLAYNKEFGDGSVWVTMHGHVNYTAKQIALMEKFGPDAKGNFARLVDGAMKDAARRDPVHTDKIKEEAALALRFMDYLVGDLPNPSAKNMVNKVFSLIRNTLVSAQLGSSVIQGLGDEVMLRASAALHGIAQGEITKLQALLATSGDARHDAMALGAALQDIARETARFGQETLGPTWSSKMANATLKVSGLHFLDTVRRGAITMGLYSKLGQLAKKHADIGALDADTNRHLLSHGLTQENWQALHLADRHDWHGVEIVTPEALAALPDSAIQHLADARVQTIETAALAKIENIKKAAMLDDAKKTELIGRLMKATEAEKLGVHDAIRNEAVQKLISIGNMEEGAVVPTPGAIQNFKMQDAYRAGTWRGELARTFFMFKGFAMSHFNTQMVERAGGMPTVGGKLWYGAKIMAQLTVAGAVTQILSDLTKGKDPRNYLSPNSPHLIQNWIAAALRGGALGLYGDLLFADESRHGHSPVAAMMGPAVGLIENVLDLTVGSAHRIASGKDPHVGAKAISTLKNIVPGQNLWFSRLFLDHLLVHNLQEAASPGYMSRMKQRSQRFNGQSFWWQPGGLTSPMRPPDLSTVAGSN
jgi:hypothetical protein